MDKMKFVTFTLNPAWDLSLVVDAPLECGAVHAICSETVTAGGKGINVGKMIAANGKIVVAGGLLGEADAALFAAEVRRMGNTPRFLTIPGRVRTNIMVRGKTGEMKFNRAGYPDYAFDRECLHAYAVDMARDATVSVISGSLPACFPQDTYLELIRVLKKHGCTVVLDASGPALLHGVAGGPAVIKPNRLELQELAGEPPTTDKSVKSILRRLSRNHEAVIFSDGPRGAWFAAGDILLKGNSPDVDVIDTTGAGDMLLGQFCSDYFPGRRLTGAVVARALAAGAAAVERPGTPMPEIKRIEFLASRVDIERLSFKCS